jgi:hypothetical protein
MAALREWFMSMPDLVEFMSQSFRPSVVITFDAHPEGHVLFKIPREGIAADPEHFATLLDNAIINSTNESLSTDKRLAALPWGIYVDSQKHGMPGFTFDPTAYAKAQKRSKRSGGRGDRLKIATRSLKGLNKVFDIPWSTDWWDDRSR